MEGMNIALDYYANVDITGFDTALYFEIAAQRQIAAGNLDSVDEFYELLQDVHGRRGLTRNDPLLFSLLYLSNHLRNQETGEMSFNTFHIESYEWARHALRGTKEASQERHCFVAPRSTGKSTLMYLLLPMWALAHQHRKFIVAFADTITLAEGHLRTFKRELDENALLRLDYPELCNPKLTKQGTSEKNTQTQYKASSNVAFFAAGLKTGVRGTKDGNRRPDWLIGDDMEPGEGNYSAYQAEERLKTLLEDIFNLNTNAVVSIVGTVTMDGSIVHQILKQISEKECPEWVTVQKIKCYYYPAIIDEADGTRSSLWSSKWSLEWLLEREHTADFQKEYMNNPRGATGGFWDESHFIYDTLGFAATQWILYIDPAKNSGKQSDQTAFCVAAFDPIGRKVEIVEVFGVNVQGLPLRNKVLGILDRHPRIRKILIEKNAGGEGLLETYRDIPCPIELKDTTKGKEYRFGVVVGYYDAKRVVHTEQHIQAEGQMIGFPKSAHDDLVDSVCLAATYFLGTPVKLPPRQRPRTRSYI